MADWFVSMVAGTPAMLWVYFGVGVPWALVALPRADWRNKPLLLAVAFAFGPALLTAWMLILGMLPEPLLRFDLSLAGTVVLAVLGAVLAWRKRGQAHTEAAPGVPLALDEKLLIGLIVIAVILRWFSTAYWPFTAYDALWVYGSQARLYLLTGTIPESIGYYPQFLQLQYTFAQLANGGVFNDHVARAVLPFLHVGSILAAYVLGQRLFTRRTGIILAALWGLYPHVADWARFGDLEIPQAFLFTLTAAFFLMAWTGQAPRRHYAVLAGLVFGVAMWNKPTAGAFILGVILLVVADFVQKRLNWRAWWPRFEVALLTGAACIPLGAVWYVRNVLLGHDAIDFPPSFWLTQAARSGAEFGWPLLALLLLFGFLHSGVLRVRPRWPLSLLGLGLVLAGLIPSMRRIAADVGAIPTHRITPLEWLIFALGIALLAWTLWDTWRRYRAQADEVTQPEGVITQVIWGLLLVLPYFVTWFASYSYHYRLSFAIVPLMALPSAVILSYWLTQARIKALTLPLKAAYLLLVLGLSMPGVVNTLYDLNAGWDWLWTDALPDDDAKYRSGNAALMRVVDGIQIYYEENGEYPVVVAPGVVRLPFFFPLADIRTDAEKLPLSLAEIEDAYYFVDSIPEGSSSYDLIPIQHNQVMGALSLGHLGEENITRYAWWHDDGTFSYNIYELHLDRRYQEPESLHDPAEAVDFGGAIRYRGHGIGGAEFWPGRRLHLQLYWEVLDVMDRDYSIYIHLRDADGTVWATWDGPVTTTQDGRYYATLLWEPGEYVRDERIISLQDENTPADEGYRIVVGVYDPLSGERLPVTIGGEAVGDGFTLNERISVLAEAP
jgi:4-amino-4-deoxy-L-arabinose transferase-like glycosyltransferase